MTNECIAASPTWANALITVVLFVCIAYVIGKFLDNT